MNTHTLLPCLVFFCLFMASSWATIGFRPPASVIWDPYNVNQELNTHSAAFQRTRNAMNTIQREFAGELPSEALTVESAYDPNNWPIFQNLLGNQAVRLFRIRGQGDLTLYASPSAMRAGSESLPVFILWHVRNDGYVAPLGVLRVQSAGRAFYNRVSREAVLGWENLRATLPRLQLTHRF